MPFTVRISSVAMLFAIACGGCAQQKPVNHKIDYFVPYCGGARPTEEITAEAERPKPYSGRTIVLLKGNKIDSVTTGASGGFSKKLRPGTYRLMESWRYYKKTPGSAPLEDFDAECLKKEWTREFAVIIVTKKNITTETKFNIVEFCEYRLPCHTGPAEPPH